MIRIKVHPRSRKNELTALDTERIRVALTAPPVAGKANQALVRLFSKILGVPQKNVAVVHGVRSRQKTLRIVGMSAGEVLSRLSPEEK